MTSVEPSELKMKTVRFWFKKNTEEKKTIEFELRKVDPHALHHILCAEFKIPVATFLWYAKEGDVEGTQIIIPESSFPTFDELEDNVEYEVRCVEA